ncbi:anthocyanidin 3-O-glucosyltransferase 5 [Spinacia oleracea]|uniref:Glycosyltransferase n=1 Tax=Spinacia oleracea TaxID=3562 RepID=A0A9R0IQ21_SPIOL|nr:anthocyanidin 3-O-glucosyltransferase 5 [Spinacia oleracea]
MVIPSKTHIALLASPGFGHFIPVVELAKRLAGLHGLTITLFAITPEVHPVQDELLRSATSSWPGLINTVILPYEEPTFPSNVDPVPRMLAMIRSVFPSLRSSISSMTEKPIALIVDHFGTEAIRAVANEFNMLKFVFICTNAWFLSYNLYLPYVKEVIKRGEPFYIPGCEPLVGDDIREFTFFPEYQTHKDFVHIGYDIASSDGILVNTWDDLEPETLLAFKDTRFMKRIVKPPVYPIGPLVRTGEPTGAKPEIFRWLDCQASGSVVYVSFGSGGTISTQQTIELAWGLELSIQRFIWVVRPPIENDSAAFLLTPMENDADGLISKYLPDGFLGRTRDMGFVVPMWAPQEEILAHGSIGAFFSHCGWNSSLESIVNGVPIIAWPLYAEQNMNATMLVKHLGVAVRPEVNPSKELVRRDEIAKMVRRVMVDEEGIGIRKRVNDLKERAKKALSEGGTSYNALSEVVKKIGD